MCKKARGAQLRAWHRSRFGTIRGMRGIFDQYEQPENRLTHALVSCLAEDKRLLRHFVRWLLKGGPPPRARLNLLEQQLPGESPVSEEEAEARGLPDAWIHDGRSWALIIESKVAARARGGQLRKYLETAHRRGFEDARLVVLAVRAPAELPPKSHFVPWSDVYSWCRREAGRSDWAGRMADYMEVLEAKMVADGYLKEGKLTVFSGVPFGRDHPYNYREAKRILRLAMGELRTREKLAKELGVDLEAPGRPAITGEESSLVWDFLRFRGEAAKDPFTKHPHLALSIRSEDVFAFLTLPNGMKTSYRRSLIRLGPGGFRSLIGEVASRLTDALKEARGACPWMEVLQRRYLRHRSIPTVDAGLRFDLRTATQCEYPERGEWPKHQPEWLDAAFSAFQNKESNLQVALGAVFPYDSCSAVHSKRAIALFAATWIACKPLIQVLVA